MLTIPHQAGEDGRLFGSVTAQDIADAIKEARGITIDRHDVRLDEPIKTVGTRMVEVEVSTGVIAIRQDHGRRGQVTPQAGSVPPSQQLRDNSPERAGTGVSTWPERPAADLDSTAP